MFSQTDLNPPSFKNTRDEIIYWKNLAFDFFKQIEVLDQQINALTQKSLKRPASPKVSSVLKSHKNDSLDPLDFSNNCEDVQSLIWQHFTGNDLVEMWSVSKAWKGRVEAEINDKTILNLPNEIQKPQGIELVRKFKTFLIQLNDTSKVESLSMIADTAESLKIVIDEKKEQTNFTNLKSLDLKFNSKIDNLSWLTKVQMNQLEELKITSYCWGKLWGSCYYCDCPFCHSYEDDVPAAQDDLIEFFVNLESLKHLDLSECPNGFLVKFYNESPQWNLETLKCKNPSAFDNNVLKSLKKLSMTHYSSYEIYDVFGSYKELSSLEIELSHNGIFNLPSRGVPVNKTIKNLSVKLKTGEIFSIDTHDAIAKVLLEAVPELETFCVTKLTSDLMRFIVNTKLKVKTMKYSEIDEKTLEEYEDMRQTQAKINRGIQFIHEN